ncbi:unnamed protein product [Meloidogyne enterolobii]|uniref:Uncharacterized protein n=1 Tax=Meloidogyne enterolobii TaxID=390850 RepID=A0ACB0Y914_MELEN
MDFNNEYLGKQLILKRNKPIILDNTFNETFVYLTTEYLQIESSNLPTNKIQFLVWHPKGGIIQYLNNNEVINDAKTIINFTQEDINKGRIIFNFNNILQQNSDKEKEEIAGFYFLYSDGIIQNNVEWFSIQQKTKNIEENNKFENKIPTKLENFELERNLILKTTPGFPAIIGQEILKVAGNIDSNQVIYRLTTPPNHGRLVIFLKIF